MASHHLLLFRDDATDGIQDGGAWHYVQVAPERWPDVVSYLEQAAPRTTPALGRGALSTRILRRVCEHIDDQLAQPIAIATLARIAELSPAHFARSFKAATGVSPKRFVRGRRILLAQKLLRSSNKPLVEIALETGFTSQSMFTTTFSAHVGVSPGRFRRHRTADAQ